MKLNELSEQELINRRMLADGAELEAIDKAWFPRFDGAVGISCYYKIAEFLGGKMEIVAQGKRYDKIRFTFRTRRTKKAL